MINIEEQQWRKCVVDDFKFLNRKINLLDWVVFFGFFLQVILNVYIVVRLK